MPDEDQQALFVAPRSVPVDGTENYSFSVTRPRCT